MREPLLRIRDHENRYTRSVMRPRERSSWHDASETGALTVPSMRLYTDYLRSIVRDVDEPVERWRCYGQLARWWVCNWNWARVGTDFLALLTPGLLSRADRLKQALFGAAPGHFPRASPAMAEETKSEQGRGGSAYARR